MKQSFGIVLLLPCLGLLIGACTGFNPEGHGTTVVAVELASDTLARQATKPCMKVRMSPDCPSSPWYGYDMIINTGCAIITDPNTGVSHVPSQSDVGTFVYTGGGGYGTVRIVEVLTPTAITLNNLFSTTCSDLVAGCMDSTALNYDPSATADCAGVVGGTDTSCCEYGTHCDPPPAILSDPEFCPGCNGGWYDANGGWGGTTQHPSCVCCESDLVAGCMDSTALNYDPSATADCAGVVGGTDTSCCEYGNLCDPPPAILSDPEFCPGCNGGWYDANGGWGGTTQHPACKCCEPVIDPCEPQACEAPNTFWQGAPVCACVCDLYLECEAPEVFNTHTCQCELPGDFPVERDVAATISQNNEEKAQAVVEVSGAKYTGEEVVAGLFLCTGPVADLLDTDHCNHPVVKSREREIAEGLEDIFGVLESEDPSFFPRMEGALQSGNPIEVKRALVEAREVLMSALTAIYGQVLNKETDSGGFIIGLETQPAESPVAVPDDQVYCTQQMYNNVIVTLPGGGACGSPGGTDSTSNTSGLPPDTEEAPFDIVPIVAGGLHKDIAVILVILKGSVVWEDYDTDRSGETDDGEMFEAAFLTVLISSNGGRTGKDKISGLEWDEFAADIAETLGPNAFPLKKG